MNPIKNTLLIPSSQGSYLIDIGSIVRIEAVSNYSRLFLSDGKKILVSKVLKQIEELLANKGFERIHRSHLVNTACIQAYNLYQMKITLHNHEQISISRRKVKSIKRKVMA